MKQIFIALTALVFLTFPAFSYAQDVEPAKAYFVNLNDGDMVQNPVHIVFGISGMDVAPAGTEEPDTGHFHLLIDTQLSDEEKQYAIPSDEHHIHFGKGQTEYTVTLSPGAHTLQIVMGDGNHMLHNPPVMSDVITVTAQE